MSSKKKDRKLKRVCMCFEFINANDGLLICEFAVDPFVFGFNLLLLDGCYMVKKKCTQTMQITNKLRDFLQSMCKSGVCANNQCHSAQLCKSYEDQIGE